MKPRSRPLALQLRADDGLGLVEVLVAVLILTVGLLGLIAAFTSARNLTFLSERRTSAAHRAQLEIERLEATPYSELLMTAAPTYSAETTNPDHYVKTGSPPEYQYGAVSTEVETLALASTECTALGTSCGVIATQPAGRPCSKYIGACEWRDGTVSGNVYDFVTWHTDTKCGAKCPTKENYKRLTVVVTVTVPSGTRSITPIRVSTLIS